MGLWLRREHQLPRTLDFGTDVDAKSLGLWYQRGHQILRTLDFGTDVDTRSLGTSDRSLDKVSVQVSLNMKRFWARSTIKFGLRTRLDGWNGTSAPTWIPSFPRDFAVTSPRENRL
ncbi:unnamed protein product [Rhizophagus irregularis]|nr:unnamed protein product [Rhizophagus irregularis]